MAPTRPATVADLDAMLAFEREFAGHDVARETFHTRFDRSPELFVVHETDGELVGAASGYAGGSAVDDDVVVLAAIGVANGREGAGIGRALLAAFEAGARRYGDVVSVASAGNVEGFYRACGYEPAGILVQVPEGSLPSDYASHGDLLDERREDGTCFCHFGFEEYHPSLRIELQHCLNATEANTIFEKRLETA